MTKPWRIVDRCETKHGVLELRGRDERDFLITIDNRILMNSHANRSELVLAQAACEPLAQHAAPQVLIGGLGMGFTARAALDTLPEAAHVTVVELTPIIEQWCRGPLAAANGNALQDPRVTVVIDDVSRIIREIADDRSKPRLDAILLDLFEGPHARTHARRDPFYGTAALDASRRALTRAGTLAIWSEAPDEAFEKRARSIGFELERRRPGKGGRRHVVYLARRSR